MSVPFEPRNDDFLYAVNSHPSYWFYVGVSSNSQGIMGLVGRKLLIILFDAKGEVDSIFTEDLPPPATSAIDSADLDTVQVLLDEMVEKVRQSKAWCDRTIHVKRFELSEFPVGVYDLPEHLEDYVRCRKDNGDCEDDLEEELEGWLEESLFRFKWVQSFTMNLHGEVTSS